MCQWPVRYQQYKALVKPQPPPTTLMPGPLGALLCRKYTFDSHSCRPLPKLGQVGSTSLRQTGKWVRRTETYPGPLLVTDTQSSDLRASRRPEMAPTTPRGQPGSWVGTSHQALTGSPPPNFQYRGFLWCSFISQSLLLLDPSPAKQSPPEMILPSPISPNP